MTEAMDYLQQYHTRKDELQILTPLANNESLPQYNLRSQISNHIYNNNGQRETLSSLITGQQSHIWLQSLSNELGTLA